MASTVGASTSRKARLAGLWRMVDAIGCGPLLARLREEVRPPVRVRHDGSHLIVYGLDAEGVVILRFAHGRSDWTSDLRQG